MKVFYTAIFFVCFLFFNASSQINKNLDAKYSKTNTYNNDLVLAWNRLFFEICQHNEGYRVPIAVRVLGYMNWAAYETAVPFSQNNASLVAQYTKIVLPNIDKNKKYCPPICINTAYYTALCHLFPKMDAMSRCQSDSLWRYFEKKYSPEYIQNDVLAASTEYGKNVAEAIMSYADTDNGATAYTNNKPPDYIFLMPKGVDKWRRTYPDYLNALTPFWGTIRPIAITIDTTIFSPPLKFDTLAGSPFHEQAYEVYRATQNQDSITQWAAEYWSDDIQFYTFDTGSRFMSIALQILEKDSSNLEKSLLVAAKIGIGLFNGSIICWKEKYQYNLLRPVSYIRTYIDSTWVTNLIDRHKGGVENTGITPAHPSYPSGHSVFGAIASVVLSNAFAQNTSFTDNSHIYRNDFWAKPRSYNSFEEMMYENAYSRIFLGVHYRMDCDEGIKIGKIIGKQINELHWEK